jgi:predicted ATPase
VLGLAEILSLVTRRLELLRDRPATDAGRAALATLVEWSHDLLHADEKTLLHQLAVHRGGAPLPALVAAGAEYGLDDATVIQLLGALVDKSIVTVSFPSAGTRYNLLDTVRDYALERLAEGGGLSAAQKTHAEYYAALADAAPAELRGPDWQACVRRLELEHDNLWAALAYARAAPDPGIAIRLGALGGRVRAIPTDVASSSSPASAYEDSAAPDSSWWWRSSASS